MKPAVNALLLTDLQRMGKKGKGKSKKMLLHVLSMLKYALEGGAGRSKDAESSSSGNGGGRRYYRPKTARYGIDMLPPQAGSSVASPDVASVTLLLFLHTRRSICVMGSICTVGRFCLV